MNRIALFISLLMLAGGAQAQTSPLGGSSGAGFGGAIAGMDSDFVAGSAPIGWQTGDEPPGTVRRYAQNEEGQWEVIGTFQSPEPGVGDDFGRSVLIHGPHIVIGAPGQSATYVFERSADGEYGLLGTARPAELGDGFEFGGAYARAGFRTQTAAFAAGQLAVTSFNASTNTGVVHFFDQDQAESTVLKGNEGEGFGYAVVGDLGDPVFIGVPGADGEKGAVDVYVNRDGMIVPEARLTADDLEARSGLGKSLAWHGGILYAGTPGLSAVLRFQKDASGEWAELDRLSAPEGEGVGLGAGVAVHGDVVLAGARGSAWVFDTNGASKLEAPDQRSQAGFGAGVAVADGAVAVSSPSADYGEGLVTVFTPGEDGWKATATLAPDISFLESIRGDQVDCEEGTAALFDCERVDLVSFVSSAELTSGRGVKMNDIWGWEDPDTGKEYVLQARTDGTAFVDISDPAHPVYVGELMRTEGSPGAAWRDVKVYKNHAFIVADGSGEHGVQIFDLTQLRDVDPADMPVQFEMTAHYTGVASTHNMVINEETGFAFAVGNRAGGETCNGQSHMIDISDPVNPVFAGCFSEESSRGTHDAQCVVYRGADADYVGREICLSSNGSSFVISDVTDKDDPRTVATATYPMTHYTHQGWLTEDHNYFYMNDELDEMNGAVDRTRTLIWDVQDLEDPQLVKQFYLDSAASDHNLYIRGNLMYQSNYQAGLRILDVSDPVNPVEVGHFDTAPYAEDAAGFGGSWSNYPYFKSGVIAVSSRAEGLFLLRYKRIDS